MKKHLHVFMLLLALTTGTALAQTTFLTQNFQGAGMPAGWSQTTSATDGGWILGINTALQSANFQIPAHTKFVCTNDDACNCDKSLDRFKTDTLDLSTASTVVLKFQYYAVNINELTLIEVSVDTGKTWVTAELLPATNGIWKQHYTNLTSLAAGQPVVMVAFTYMDQGTYGYGFAVDDVSIYQPVAVDAALTAVTPVQGSSAAIGVTASNLTLGGTVTNYGATTINGCVIKWSDGTNTQSYTFNTSIPVTGSAVFAHSVPYNIPGTSQYPLKIWVELAGDAVHANDTLNTAITGAVFTPVHKITFEDQAVSCSGFGIYTPRGIVMKDAFVNSANGNKAEVITVHWKGYDAPYDPMYDSVAAYAMAEQTVLGGIAWPEIHTDRKERADVNLYDSMFTAHTADFGVADLAVTVDYNANTRAVTVNTDAHFAIDVSPASAKYNLALVLTEDSVHGTDTGYTQRNAYAGGVNGPLAGAGIDFAAEPDPVPADKMYYMHVARKLIGPFSGISGSLPTTISAGSYWSYSFPAYTVPAQYNANKMRAIVLLIDTITNEIRNANGAPFVPLAGLHAATNTANSFKVFPNPFADETRLVFSLAQSENVSLRVSNIVGETITNYEAGLMASGENTLVLNGKNLSPGMYLVTLKIGNSLVTRKVMLSK